MMHLSTGFPLNFTINSLSPTRQTLSTQLAVVLSNIIAMPRCLFLLSESFWNRHIVILSRPSCLTYSQNIPNQAISCALCSPDFPFCTKVLTFQHTTFWWNFFLRTHVVRIL